MLDYSSNSTLNQLSRQTISARIKPPSLDKSGGGSYLITSIAVTPLFQIHPPGDLLENLLGSQRQLSVESDTTLKVPDPEIEGLGLVLRGSFNPSIFQPAWFVAQNLLMQREGDSAKIEIIRPEVVGFSTERFAFYGDDSRLRITTDNRSAFDQIRDLFVSTLELLPHTPVQKLGINLNIHYRMPDREVWNALGNMLTPKEIWIDVLTKPGMLDVYVRGDRTDGHSGAINVKIEPSTSVDPGVYFNINDHYEFDEEGKASGKGCRFAVEILRNTFENSLTESRRIIHAIFDRV